MRVRGQVGTAKNIAMACNILPASAKVLEITCETFEVLSLVSNAKMLAIQRKIEAASGHGRPSQAGDAEPSWAARVGRRLTECVAPVGALLQSSTAADRQSEVVAELIKSETEALDVQLPGLVQVRVHARPSAPLACALRARVRATTPTPTPTPVSASVGVWTRSTYAWRALPHSQVRAALASRLLELQQTVEGAADEAVLILDEKAIEYCGTLCQGALAAVGNAARSVVACRARKDQKAQMLRLIKDTVPDSCCLAVGDGANDVAMIQAGHLGVGIIGKEGMQAVNNSDFAIGQFRFLRGLLLVHGRANYRRMAIFNYFVLYKVRAGVHTTRYAPFREP